MTDAKTGMSPAEAAGIVTRTAEAFADGAPNESEIFDAALVLRRHFGLGEGERKSPEAAENRISAP